MSNSQLMQKVTSLIHETGRITFACFMEMALYDEEYGYYVTGGSRSSLESPVSPIGTIGSDFYTIPSQYPLFAQCFLRQIQEIDTLLGHPPVFTILEIGSGEGFLARDLLKECANADQFLFQRLKFAMVERSPALRKIQRQTLISYNQKEGKISWINDLTDLSDQSVIGLILSNELIDAFPVHRIQMEEEGLKEIYVSLKDGQLVEELGVPSTDELIHFLDDMNVQLPVGFRTEINLQAIAWIKEVSRILHKGLVITIDYGHTTQDYFSIYRKTGTLLCYFNHMVSTDPYERVGEQDITTHVNFSSLAKSGKKTGLSVTGFTNLMHFLMSLKIENLLEDCTQEAEVVQSAIQLLRPHGIGTTFKILVQHKGINVDSLQGLQLRPFLDTALTAVCCKT